jgi:hypothetical protein
LKRNYRLIYLGKKAPVFRGLFAEAMPLAKLILRRGNPDVTDCDTKSRHLK